ncbi:ester cyclase [Streptomyces puniciscabiei]|uniref:ester cyclase n=1 Tax=Streptomyces puniciscabiei TaxID=164348 RepID=UPI00099E5959|nr:ester cyclase [Streptomyces puniciscabiei]
MEADAGGHARLLSGPSARRTRTRTADEPGAAFEGLRRQSEALAPLTVRVDELIGEGDRVVARVTQRGVHSGAHPRMPEPTGRSFEIEAIWIFTLREGKIAEIRAVSDRLGLFAQLGWPLPEG